MDGIISCLLEHNKEAKEKEYVKFKDLELEG